MQLVSLVAIFFAIFTVIFALQNNIPVTVTMMMWHFESSLAVVLLLALAIGGAIVALVSTPSTLRRQWEVRRLNQKISDLEIEIRGFKYNRSQIAESSIPQGSEKFD
ncbi:MAG: LapA family protein [Gallionella sp.]